MIDNSAMGQMSMMNQNQTQQQMMVAGMQQDAPIGVAVPVIMPPGQIPQQQPQVIALQATQQQQPSTGFGPMVQPFVYRKQGTKLFGTYDQRSNSFSQSEVSGSVVSASDYADDESYDDDDDDGGSGGGSY